MISQVNSWEYYYFQAKSSKYLTNTRKNQLKKALNIIRENFGDDWFKSSREKHPLFWDLRGLEA